MEMREHLAKIFAVKERMAPPAFDPVVPKAEDVYGAGVEHWFMSSDAFVAIARMIFFYTGVKSPVSASQRVVGLLNFSCRCEREINPYGNLLCPCGWDYTRAEALLNAGEATLRSMNENGMLRRHGLPFTMGEEPIEEMFGILWGKVGEGRLLGEMRNFKMSAAQGKLKIAFG